MARQARWCHRVLRIVLRSPNAADIVYEHSPAGARFEVVENGPAAGDAVVTTDTANRTSPSGDAGQRNVR